jgi:CDP-diacylglycerol--glycerol-3-phosphate 3-phosphatidyltransferase
MQIPNMLTVSRFFLAIAILALLALPFPFFKSLALLVFIIGGITDFLDGYLARNHYGISSFGKLMDPLADKVMVSACFISFVEIRHTYETGALVPAFIVVLIIAREFMVTGLRLLAANKGKTISAGKWGKHKTVWQIVAIVVILLGLAVKNDILDPNDEITLRQFEFAFKWTALALSAAVAVITVASGVKYFTDHKDLVSRNL